MFCPFRLEVSSLAESFRFFQHEAFAFSSFLALLLLHLRRLAWDLVTAFSHIFASFLSAFLAIKTNSVASIK